MRKVLSVILVIVMIATCMPAVSAAGKCEHTFAYYTSKGFGLTIEKCTSCSATSVDVDSQYLNNFTTDIYVSEFGRFHSYLESIYENEEEALMIINGFLQDAQLIFDEEITDVSGLENYNFKGEPDVSKEWIDENTDKLPVITLVYGYVNAMLDNARADGELSVVIDPIELVKVYNSIVSSYPLESCINFTDGLDQEIKARLDESVEKLNYVTYEDKSSDQADFDAAAEPIIRFYLQMKNCLDGIHNGECTDLGDGTHRLECILCSFVSEAEAHTFGEYIPDDNGTTATAKCESCDATKTVEVEWVELPAEDNSNFFTALIATFRDIFAKIAEFFKSIFG